MTQSNIVLGVIAIRLAGVVLTVLILRTLPDPERCTVNCATAIHQQAGDVAHLARAMHLHD